MAATMSPAGISPIIIIFFAQSLVNKIHVVTGSVEDYAMSCEGGAFSKVNWREAYFSLSLSRTIFDCLLACSLQATSSV
jgi:hypothetical protein